jgi:hypothetical protein
VEGQQEIRLFGEWMAQNICAEGFVTFWRDFETTDGIGGIDRLD